MEAGTFLCMMPVAKIEVGATIVRSFSCKGASVLNQ